MLGREAQEASNEIQKYFHLQMKSDQCGKT
jgi:hypothetical protein